MHRFSFKVVSKISKHFLAKNFFYFFTKKILFNPVKYEAFYSRPFIKIHSLALF